MNLPGIPKRNSEATDDSAPRPAMFRRLRRGLYCHCYFSHRSFGTGITAKPSPIFPRPTETWFSTSLDVLGWVVRTRAGDQGWGQGWGPRAQEGEGSRTLPPSFRPWQGGGEGGRQREMGLGAALRGGGAVEQFLLLRRGRGRLAVCPAHSEGQGAAPAPTPGSAWLSERVRMCAYGRV